MPLPTLVDFKSRQGSHTEATGAWLKGGGGCCYCGIPSLSQHKERFCFVLFCFVLFCLVLLVVVGWVLFVCLFLFALFCS